MKKILVLVLLTVCTVVFAEEVQETTSSVNAILATVITVFGTALATLAAGLVNFILAAIAKKAHLEIDGKIKYEIGMSIRTGIASAEAWANKQNEKPTSSDKLNYALGVVKTLAGSDIVKNFTDKQLVDYIEAHLISGTVNEHGMPVHDITADIHKEE